MLSKLLGMSLTLRRLIKSHVRALSLLSRLACLLRSGRRVELRQAVAKSRQLAHRQRLWERQRLYHRR